MAGHGPARFSETVRRFLEASRVPGILATVGRSGGPVTSAVWFAVAGDTILVSTPAEGTKARNVRADGRVSFIVDSKERPYHGVAIEGVATIVDDADLRQWRTIARRYLGDDVSPEMRTRAESGARAIIEVIPHRVRTWNLPDTE